MSWQPLDIISKNKLDQMVSNEDWIRDHSVRGVYRAHETKRTEQLKLVGGLVRFPPTKKGHANSEVFFGNIFAAPCEPIVTTGIISPSQHRIHVTIEGLGRFHPDHRGFRANVSMDAVNKKNNRIKRLFYVSWQAFGY